MLVRVWKKENMVQPLATAIIRNCKQSCPATQQASSGRTPKENEITTSSRYQHCCVHRSAIHSSQDAETT